MTEESPSSTTEVKSKNRFVDLFQLPAPIRQLFDKFPLRLYPSNQLPGRSPYIQGPCLLHVFSTEEDCLNHSPSFNPSCLKWQVSSPRDSCESGD